MKKILHISDIHASCTPLKGQSRQSVEMLKDSILEDMEILRGTDKVVISGDLTYSGKKR